MLSQQHQRRGFSYTYTILLGGTYAAHARSAKQRTHGAIRGITVAHALLFRIYMLLS